MKPEKDTIKVLIVDDSPSMCKVLEEILNTTPKTAVAGIVHNGKEAVELIPQLNPDIILMDILMPVMDGLEATRQIMAYNPTPILVLSAAVSQTGTDMVFKAISYGALDVVDKNKMNLVDDKKQIALLIEKMKFLSRIEVIRHPLGRIKAEKVKDETLEVSKRVDFSDMIVAIVSSTGGPQALLKIFKRLPKEFPCGIVVVQHITHGFVEGLANWLDNECQIKVKVAEDSETICPGVAYLAPTDLQMRVEKKGLIRLYDEPLYTGHRPSGDMLLDSAAKVYGKGTIGIILTGMGKDGSLGTESIKKINGQIIAQAEEGCTVFGMPKTVIEMGLADKVLTLEKISEEVMIMLGDVT